MMVLPVDTTGQNLNTGHEQAMCVSD